MSRVKLDTNSECLFRIRLKELMKEKKLNQTDLGKLTGFARKTISEYVTGKSIPDKWHFETLAKRLNVSKEYLSGQSPYRNVFDSIDESDPEYISGLQHKLAALRYLDYEYELDKYDHGETKVLESHTETETYDGKEIQVTVIDNFEDDYTKLIDEIEEYITFKTNQFKEKHRRLSPDEYKGVKKRRRKHDT